MIIERALFLLAGSMIILSVGLSHFVHENFVYLTLFVGINMIQFSFTAYCPASWLFKRMGMRSKCDNVKSS